MKANFNNLSMIAAGICAAAIIIGSLTVSLALVAFGVIGVIATTIAYNTGITE